jgi:hypothetical protein
VKEKFTETDRKMESDWQQLPYFTVDGWDGFTTWASCHEGVVSVERRMIHPNGKTYTKPVKANKQGCFVLALPQMKGVGNGGATITSAHTPERVLAHTLDFVPWGAEDAASASKYHALKIDDSIPLSFDNVEWYKAGEANRRGRRVSCEELTSKNTPQVILDQEEFRSVRLRCFDRLGKATDTYICEDDKYQVSNIGRVRYILGDNGHYHYTLGAIDIKGYRIVSIDRFLRGKRRGVHILVMHTFLGFPDDLGYDVRFTSIDHANRDPSCNELHNLTYRNLCFQSFNRSYVLQKYGVDDVDDLPEAQRVRMERWTPPLPPDQVQGTLETRAHSVLRDTPLSSLQKFLRNVSIENASDGELASISESLFLFTWPELETIFDTSDWVFPFLEWKKLDISNMIPRDRVESILKALNYHGVQLDKRTDVFSNKVMTARVKMLFNRVYMYHHYIAFGYSTQHHNTELSKKRKREDI